MTRFRSTVLLRLIVAQLLYSPSEFVSAQGCSSALRTSMTEIATDGVDGYVTYQLFIELPADAVNVYAIAGIDESSPLSLPPAWQSSVVENHIGAPDPGQAHYSLSESLLEILFTSHFFESIRNIYFEQHLL